MPHRRIHAFPRAALSAALGSALVTIGAAAAAPLSSTTLAVTSCDDAGPGSLREAVSLASSGDTIDLGALACDTIALTSGAIVVSQDDLAIEGPGRDALAIDGGGGAPTAARVFEHPGFGRLSIAGLSIRNGSHDDGASPDAYGASGGCIVSLGSVSLAHSRVTGCRLTETGDNGNALGGGIYAFGNLIAEHSILDDNRATATNRYARGGSAYIRGNVQIEHSTLDANAVEAPSYSSGGGLFVGNEGDSDSMILASTISGNTASFGAGLILKPGADDRSVAIFNSTVSGNAAGDAAGGIYSRTALELRNSTVTSNHAQSTSSFAAGVALWLSPLDLHSSIIAGNGAIGGGGSDVSITGAALTGTNNLVSVAIAELPADTLIGDPMLEPLADNGGPTATHALHPDSPAIGAGNNAAALSHDQRGPGFPREIGDATDIGAFEYSGVDPDRVFANGFET